MAEDFTVSERRQDYDVGQVCAHLAPLAAYECLIGAAQIGDAA